MLLAIDPGTDTGVAWSYEDGTIHHTTWRLGPHQDQRSIRLVDNLVDILREQTCMGIGYEEPFVGPYVNAAQSLFVARGMIRYVATRLRIPVYGYTPKEIKQSIAGGRATKDRMIATVTMLGHKPANEHEADALALLLLMRTGALPQEGVRKTAARQHKRKAVDLFSKSSIRRASI